MTAQELRIGNYVLFSEDSTVLEIEEISKNGLGVKNEIEDVWIEIDMFEPISLTEKWLIKFGFEYQGGEGYLLEDGGIRIYASLRNDWMIYNSKHIENSKGVRYVHELQNLCFALFRKELTLKENNDVN